MTPKKLRDLQVMDVYLRLDCPGIGQGIPRYRSAARDKSNIWTQRLPEDYWADAGLLLEKLQKEGEPVDAAFTYDGMRFRFSRQTMANNEVWGVLRRIQANVPLLEKLGYSPHIAAYLQNLGRRDGLILFSGATGHGKTTTCFSLLQAYLHAYGGVGMTVEDPVEYVLEGECGQYGYCYQVQVKDGDWAEPLKRSLRWTPRYLLVGEIRTPAAAEQVLRAATTGHLVLSTIHAGSVEDSLLGLLHLARQALGASANVILAQALTATIHQTLQAKGPYIRYLFTEESNNGDPIRALIREDRIGMINTYIDRQIARMAQLEGR